MILPLSIIHSLVLVALAKPKCLRQPLPSRAPALFSARFSLRSLVRLGSLSHRAYSQHFSIVRGIAWT